jgi:hypothetical protein
MWGLVTILSDVPGLPKDLKILGIFAIFEDLVVNFQNKTSKKLPKIAFFTTKLF